MALTIVFWNDFFFGQISIQFGIGICMIIFLQWVRPLESNFATNLETFNEVINLFTFYLLLSFSDFVGEAETRGYCGWFFIGVTCFFAAVHFCILASDSFRKLRR